MSEDYSSHTDKHEKSWLDKLLHAFSDEPRSRDELLEIIKDAADE